MLIFERHYIPLTGEIRIMFDQESQRASYMDSFFKENSNDGLSWIHDLGQGRFGPAASSLLKVAESATNLEGKHVRVITAFRLIILD